MITRYLFDLLFLCSIIGNTPYVNAQSTPKFTWPEGKMAVISLSFDDGRFSQVERGTALLDSMKVKATFYVVPSAVEERLEGWKAAVRNGHEIGNHSLFHPCSGNFEWSRDHALENYTLDSMRDELQETNSRVQKMLGVKPAVFAYPCGQKFVGRGLETKSYVPLIAEMFLTGRGYLEETANDPLFTDFAQITGIEMDGKDFEQLLPVIGEALRRGLWVVLAGHEMGDEGFQTTRLNMLRKLVAYAQDPANKIWLAPVGEVATYIKAHAK